MTSINNLRVDQRRLLHSTLLDAWAAADKRQDFDAGENVKECLDMLGLPWRRLTDEEWKAEAE